MMGVLVFVFFFSSRRRHTRCALVTGVQTCALPICPFSRLQRPIQPLLAIVCVCGIPGGHQMFDFRPERRERKPGIELDQMRIVVLRIDLPEQGLARPQRPRSEEHTSELQSLMRISYAVFCLKKKNKPQNSTSNH